MSRLFLKNPRRASFGFSVMEMLIYIAILAVISVLAVNSILIIIKSFNQYRLLRFINAAGQMSMERIIREIRLAGDIDETGSVFDIHPGRLKLNTVDPDTETSTTMEFFVSSDVLMLKKGETNAIPLTSDNVSLANLTFRKISASSAKAVKIEMEIRSENGDFSKAEKFNNGAVLRKSY